MKAILVRVGIAEGGVVLRFELVEVGSGGRTACMRCGGTRGAAVYLPVDDIVSSIVTAAARSTPPGPNIMLGGADAFGHPQLPVLVGAAVEAGVVRIGLETDGGALAAAGNAAGALHAGVRHVRVGSGNDAAARAGIAAWTEAARVADVDAVATAMIAVCAHTVRGLASSVAALCEAGAAGITLDARSLRATPDVSAEVVSACDTGTVNGVWVDVLGPDDLLPSAHRLHRWDHGGLR